MDREHDCGDRIGEPTPLEELPEPDYDEYPFPDIDDMEFEDVPEEDEDEDSNTGHDRVIYR